MTDFSSIKSKVDDLKAKVAQNSISPAYLGALLDDFITAMQSIDVTGMSDEVRSALANSASALAKANEALSKADASDATAVLAAKSAVKAADDAAAALEQAAAAVAAASSASQAANTALASAAEAITASDAAKAAADDATAAITDFGGRLDANDTKTAQLSTRVNTLTDKVAGISILPFDGVFDPPTDGSVIQFPAGGVWWQPQEGNFLFLSSDLGYVAADYNTDGAARTDRIFRRDNILYRYDGSSLVSNEASLEKIAAKTAQLTSGVDTLSDKVAAMNILPFDGVFDPPTDGSVVQYPAQGVWWQPQEANFLFISSDLGYVAGDYNEHLTADIIRGRTDRIFCHDNILYHYSEGHTLFGAGVSDWEAQQIEFIPRLTERLENQENLLNVIAGVFDGQIKELKARVDAIEEATEEEVMGALVEVPESVAGTAVGYVMLKKTVLGVKWKTIYESGSRYHKEVTVELEALGDFEVIRNDRVAVILDEPIRKADGTEIWNFNCQTVSVTEGKAVLAGDYYYSSSQEPVMPDIVAGTMFMLYRQ